MSTPTTTHRPVPALKAGGALLALRIFATLSTLNVLCQGITAGEVLMKNHGWLAFHEMGAVLVHVLTGLTAIAAVWHWRATRGSVWPTIVAVVLFIATFVQAEFGHGRTLYIHVPLALFILLAAACLVTWSFFTPRAAGNARTW
jgi:hypothetical protein